VTQYSVHGVIGVCLVAFHHLPTIHTALTRNDDKPTGSIVAVFSTSAMPLASPAKIKNGNPRSTEPAANEPAIRKDMHADWQAARVDVANQSTPAGWGLNRHTMNAP